ncbi:oxidoreductase [Cytobacillus firmus]|uniref:DoxX family protein n=1 Tax=Cytobacillus firmus TaxID=1399 RepID=UPI00077CD7F5|nr:DoxX family protein [Cytobacillus firmus]MBG9544358.1 oxidoreductase [Cytobacillus firmus]MBG9553315.1 oxidoreductase [Cytobacillus firmus]MBG9558084.1 oxidoreductase [Cytobacillus firmus]MBG9575112.1 oxidoreductase [Cytobacillus firmus]MEC1894462.1 DoxX family protein [Cytobacillus firmus]
MNKNELGHFILRAILGFVFFIHGLSKFQGGISNTAGFFDSIGIPGFMAYPVAAIELAGGIALILGMGTKIVSVLFALIMLGAIFTAKLPAGLLGNGQVAGYELDLILLAASIYFVLAKESPLSLENKLTESKAN